MILTPEENLNMPLLPSQIIEGLRPYLTDQRIQRIEHVVRNRITTVVPVLEGLYDRGNVSAVLRSAEGMGYGTIHVIDSSPHFKEAKRVTQGAEKWLDLQMWDSSPPCFAQLKDRGFRLLATHLEGARDIQDFDFNHPTALIFGNEREGVSAQALAAADATVKIPMTGFSQSFNISVAAALFLYHIRETRRRPENTYGDLDAAAQEHLLADYYFRSVPNAEALLNRHYPAGGQC